MGSVDYHISLTGFIIIIAIIESISIIITESQSMESCYVTESIMLEPS